MFRWLFLPLLLSICSPVCAEPVEVDSTGTGATRQEAIAQGLIEAIQQVTGVAVDATLEMRSAVASLAVDDAHTISMTETQQTDIRRAANGIVRSFQVLEVMSDEPGRIVLHLSVAVEKFQPTGIGTDSRRRIAVASFGGPRGVRPTADLLRDRLTAQLTQSRRFLVLDRANDQVYQQEMALLTTEAPLAERVRIGQAVGTDYAVIGQIRKAGVSRSDRVIAMTGERVVTATSSVEIDWSVLEIATRAIKYAGSVRLAADGDVLGVLLDRTAASIAKEIAQAIYPMRLIRFADPEELIINQGGDTLQLGQRFRAMRLSGALVDPYTKEPLGEVEREVGVVEVRRVDQKVSYARLITGKLPTSDAEIVLRPAAPIPVRAVPARAVAAPVIKLPGDP